MKQNEKKKVLHLISTNIYSGAENVAAQIIKGLEKNKSYRDYEMVYCSTSGKIDSILESKKIKHLKLKKFNYFEIKKIIKEYNPDIIHAHDIKASIYAGLLKTKQNKVISHVHVNNKNMSKLNLKTLLYNLVTNKFDKIIWVSKSCYENYKFKNKKKIKANSEILYNVINKQEIYDLISKNDEFVNQYDLIYLGRLTYQKNPQRLIELINLIKQEKEDLKVAIIGDGEYKEEIETKIKELKLENNIKMYGFLSNPYKILNNSKILLMTSRFEGTPMCAIEAMALNKVIVSTPTDGLVDLIKNNETGVYSNDNETLKNSILEILNNKSKYNNMVKNVEKRYLEIFDYDNYMKKINEMYN